MATIARFEDIQAWQKARELVSAVYAITSKGALSKDYGLRDQLRRASVSVMGNIAEGFARRSNREFANFLNLAHASAAELQSHLYVALDQQYVSPKAFEVLYGEIEEVSKMTLRFSAYLRETDAGKLRSCEAPKVKRTLAHFSNSQDSLNSKNSLNSL